jgi:hypothetical protein
MGGWRVMRKRFALFAALIICIAVCIGSTDAHLRQGGGPAVMPRDPAAPSAEPQIEIDVIFIPLEYTVALSIHEDMPPFEFRLEGMYVHHAESGDFLWTEIENLTITGANGFRQEFGSLDVRNSHAVESIMYGLAFDDWNFDGYLDISLWRMRAGGGAMAMPSYFWLWNNDAGKFETCEQLEALSNFCAIEIGREGDQIVAYYWIDRDVYGISYLIYDDNGDLLEVRRIEEIWGEDGIRVIVYELMFGEMVVIEDYYFEG